MNEEFDDDFAPQFVRFGFYEWALTFWLAWIVGFWVGVSFNAMRSVF